MKIIVECVPDTILMKCLGVLSRRIHHAGSKGRVIKNVERGLGTGIIDEDPGYTQPKILSKYSLLESDERLGLKVLSRGDKKLIVISPHLEEFILSACMESNIDPTKFGLPKDPYYLHRVINSKPMNFKKLLNELLKLRNTRLIRLRSIIQKQIQGKP